ncbi:hypothetical protein AB0I28_12735 [Phytomonospora sp. NPDC050363]|uniref:hypothetical protein n=1 Tax=Phytomonospora sp. NPDC050363 TaxID=3155642 RepID=UPI0033F6BA36
MTDLTPAEKAAMEVIEVSPDDLVSDEELARRVVEAVRPLILKEERDRIEVAFMKFVAALAEGPPDDWDGADDV